MKIGDYVWYVGNPHKGKELGRITRVGEDTCGVVYRCRDNWHEYQDYTSVRTRTTDLELLNEQDIARLDLPSGIG